MSTNRITIMFALAISLGGFSFAQDAKKPGGEKATPAKKSGTITAVVGADAYTITKGVIKNSVVLIQDGKVRRVGQNIPIPENAIHLDAKGKVLTPGFVSVSASGVGIRGAGGQVPGRGGPPTPGATPSPTRISDSLDPFDRNIVFCLASGITTACVELPGAGRGRFGRDSDWWELDTSDDTNVCPCCGMTFLPTEPIRPTPPAEATVRRHAVLRMTYGDMTAMLAKESPFYHLPAGAFAGAMNRHQWREQIKRAREQLDGKEAASAGDVSTGGRGSFGRRVADDLLKLVKKEIPLRTDASSIEQMRDMMALARELDYQLVLDGVHEAWLIPAELRDGKVQAILTPRSRRRPIPGNEEKTGSSIETSGALEKAGVPFAVAPLGTSVNLGGIAGRDLMSLPLEAAFAVRGGASEQAALAALTIVPSRMLGLDERIGSIEEGKDADLLILDGNPLDYRTHVEKALIAGKVYYDRTRDRVLPDAPAR